jgi:signal peptidase
MRFAHNAVADEGTKPSRIPKKYQSIVIFLRDAAVAAAFVALVLLAMFAYTGLWPPLVVVESNSMMHGEDNHSNIGTIDTGDLVLVKKIDSVSDIETYMDSQISGHKTYGDYGDVVIYKRGGSDASTPIIHRALIYLEINADGTSYRSESLRQVAADKWSTSDPTDTWDRLTSSLTINDVGYNHLSVTIDAKSLAASHRSGFITKGDHNLGTDQMYAAYGPVDFEWIVGKARGEIPWFGLLKLWSTGSLGSPSPDNSVRDLWASLAIIVATPMVIDIALTYREKREVSKKRTAELLLEKGSGESKEEKKAEGEDLDKASDQPPKRP